jgi:hypothetical protein
MTQYDDTDRGAAFPPSDNQQLILTGPINDNGDDSRVAVVKSKLDDGRIIFDVYQKVGRLFDNDVQTPNAPNFTGPWRERRMAVWTKEKDGRKYMSISLSDKQERNNDNAPEPMPAATGTADDIPF